MIESIICTQLALARCVMLDSLIENQNADSCVYEGGTACSNLLSKSTRTQIVEKKTKCGSNYTLVRTVYAVAALTKFSNKTLSTEKCTQVEAATNDW